MKIEVVPYNPKWPELFEVEVEKIRRALGENCIAIHQIGSTSVPGLHAKPIIDIIPVVKNIRDVDQYNEVMRRDGFEAFGENGIAFRRFFKKGNGVNVHVYQEGDQEIVRNLMFRDWLRNHPEDAKEYGDLKLGLAGKAESMLEYYNGKDAFVANVVAKCGYEGYRLVKALTDREWAKVYALRGNSDGDVFDHKDHIHFAFYKDSNVVGYAYLQLFSEGFAVLKCMRVDEECVNDKSLLLNWCERWLSHQNYTRLLVQYPKMDFNFYWSFGYSFDDFNGFEGLKFGKRIDNQV